jgi:hypothetical protein
VRTARILLAVSVLLGSPVAASVPYPQKLAAIDRRRVALAAELAAATTTQRRAAVLGSARTAAFSAITDDVLPAWYGTPWGFYGTTETPGQGTIACGYLVTTVLRDAGFRVERRALAQQASERIVQTLAPADRILRFRGASPDAVLRGVRATLGDGLFVVGMDYHVAFLVLDGPRADLCHSAVLPPAHVVCEPAAEAAAFSSSYYVVGPALDDTRLLDWLAGAEIPTAARR